MSISKAIRFVLVLSVLIVLGLQTTLSAAQGSYEVLAEDILQLIRDGSAVDFEGVTVRGALDLTTLAAEGAPVVSIDVSLRLADATFTGPVVVRSANDTSVKVQFNNSVDFGRSQFQGAVDFADTQFAGVTRFDNVTFNTAATFANTVFESSSNFSKARFVEDGVFSRAEFLGNADFTLVTYRKKADFQKKRFTTSAFTGSRFEGEADFNGSEFRQDADFTNVNFRAKANFRETVFSGVIYAGAQFAGAADFFKARFDQDAFFSSTTFQQNATFTKTRFLADANFSQARFLNNAFFAQADFNQDVSFRAAVFQPEGVGDTGTTFLNASFDTVDFRRAQFAAASLKLIGTDYSLLQVREFDLNVLDSPDDPLDHIDVLQKLEDNFRAQGQITLANNVLYERSVAERGEKSALLQLVERLFVDIPFGYFVRPENTLTISLVLIAIFAILFYHWPRVIGIPQLAASRPKERRLSFRLREVPVARENEFQPPGTDQQTVQAGELPRWGLGRRLWEALSFSFAVFTKVSFGGRVANRQRWLLAVVIFEWALGAAMLAGLAYTLSQTIPILQVLLGSFF
jgi:hypothetical protein